MKICLQNFRLYIPKKGKDRQECLLNSVSTVFRSGHLNVLAGPSGSGKTSLLNVLANMGDDFDGSVLFNGEDIRKRKDLFKNYLSYVTADGCCIPELTVLDHLKLVSNDRKAIDRVMKDLSLRDLKNRKTALCSTGEQARTAIAVALLKNTPILLLDEPTANLDEANKKAVFGVLSEYSVSHLVIVATHDAKFIEDGCSRYEIKDGVLAMTAQDEEKADRPLFEKAHVGGRLMPTFLKLSLPISFKHAIQFGLSFLLMSVFLMCSFLSSALSEVDKEATFGSAIDSLPYGYNQVRDENNPSLSLGESVFAGEEGVFVATTMQGNGTTVNMTCLEDLDESLAGQLKGVFDDFTLGPAYANDETHAYYPILITSEQQRFLSKSLSIVLKTGDLFPFSLIDDGYAVSHATKNDFFVVAGVFDYGTDQGVSSLNLDESFPCVMKRDDYLSCLRANGIRCWSIEKSLNSLFTDYAAYCEAHGIGDPISSPDFLPLTTLVRYSDFAGLFAESGTTPSSSDGKIYYSGKRPLQEDWIMLPDDSGDVRKMADLLQYDEGFESREDKGFFAPYLKDGAIGFPLVDAYEPIGLVGKTSAVVSGSYYLNEEGITMKDCVMVSDSLYAKLFAQIEGGGKEGPGLPAFFADRNYVKTHVASLLSGDIAMVSSAWEACVLAYGNAISTAKFITGVAIAMGVLSLLISAAYAINVHNGFLRSFATLDLMGKGKWSHYLLLGLGLMPLLVPSYLVSVSFSGLLVKGILALTAKGSSFSGVLAVSGTGLAYAVQIAALLAFSLIVFLLSFLGRRKKAVSEIKEEA
ncbi:MAG: ATP-binding cassette domain-containing protein [Bacilli bacterium]|nr:ATP-binding cassette domain-containing protein [Bacilli bacterium]